MPCIASPDLSSHGLAATLEPQATGNGRRKYRYHVYGIPVRSDLRFPLEEGASTDEPLVEMFFGGPVFFEARMRGLFVPPDPENWREHLALADGSDYVRWPELFEFLISADGRRIAYNPLSPTSALAFETYLLSMVLSYSLLKLGYEVLHATAVIIDGEALALLGPSGHGKSTFAAAFLQAGFPILTDDLLVVKETRKGMVVPPGVPRIKLFAETADRFLPFPVAGEPMNPLTDKLVVPLSEQYSWREPARLRALYRLPDPWEEHSPPTRGVETRSCSWLGQDGGTGFSLCITPMQPKAAFTELLAATFNATVREPARLQRNFVCTSRLFQQIPLRRVFCRRDLDSLPEVRDAIIRDFRRIGPGSERTAHRRKSVVRAEKGTPR
jgi:hypothetical protein